MRAALSQIIAALLLLAALASPSPALADEWNDSFAEPRPYKLLKGIAVRGGPGNSTERLGSLSEGDVVHVLEIVNGWHRFDFQGRQGWIFKRYLRPMAAGEPGSEAGSQTGAPASVPDASDAVADALNEIEEQVAEAPPAEEPAAELPAEQPATEEPAAEEPVPAQPAAEEPAAEKAIAGESTTEKPAPDKSIDEEQAAEAPALEEDSAEGAPRPESPAEEPAERKRVARTPTESVSPEDCPRFTSLQINPESREVVFEGAVTPEKKACFRILTLEDWILEITLRSESDQARFDVFTPQEGRLVGTMSAWAHSVDVSGDKQIVVHTTGAGTRYSLHVLVRQP